MPSSVPELNDLARRLKQEKLFVTNERKELECLNRKVQLLSTGLLNQTWLTGQHRLALEEIAYGSSVSLLTCPFVSYGEGDSEPSEILELLDAHKYISGTALQTYTDLIGLIRAHPEIIAQALHLSEKEIPHTLRPVGNSSNAIGSVYLALLNVYGGVAGPLPDDEIVHLKLLKEVACCQLVEAESPRMVLRQRSSSFKILYHVLSETLPSSKLFLIGALHSPVTQLLSSFELLSLGTDLPAMSPVQESNKSFSRISINGEIESVVRTEKIAKLAKMFFDCIMDSMHSFPVGLAGLIKVIHATLSSKFPEKEVNCICTDLVWALFICPAVTNPEIFGVTDAPVGYQARHTLTQVATLLQALALQKYEGTTDPRISEYASYFEFGSLSAVLEQILNLDQFPAENSAIISALSRRTVLIPENLLIHLFSWLKDIVPLLENNQRIRNLDSWESFKSLALSAYKGQSNIIGNSSTANFSPNSSSSSLNTSFQINQSNISPSSSSSNILTNGKRAFLSLKDSAKTSTPNNITASEAIISVIVFPITEKTWEWVGMLPESEVVSPKNGKDRELTDAQGMEEQYDDEREERSSIGEKRTRFSLSHDDGSVGTSDNLEAVSENASTHSVSSSIELEDHNDNLSDMLSANVSGRGTPNVSGRNTPLSQAEQDEHVNNVVEEDDIIMNEAMNNQARVENQNNINPPNLNTLNINAPNCPNPSEQARSEIADKFCKFEIKKQIGGDETVSLVSDTWSTDVLASDSEIGDTQQIASVQGIPNRPAVVGLSAADFTSAVSNCESVVSNDTMSEAWSTDVAVSDVERLNELETDDTASVARSDDTGRSEFEAAPYDTPRSSVSGAPPCRRMEPDSDLLIFDDTSNGRDRGDLPASQQESMDSGSSAPVPMDVNSSGDVKNTVQTETQGSEETKPIPPNSMLAEVSVANVTSTACIIPEIVSPSSSSSNLQNSPSCLQTPNTNRLNNVGKTITFDKTAEKGDRDWEDGSGKTRKFFRNFRLPFRGRSRKSRANDDRMDWEKCAENPSLTVPRLRKSFSEDVAGSAAMLTSGETSDEILAKYRRKPSFPESENNTVISKQCASISRKESVKISKAEFMMDAKRRLRNVLSTCELQFFQSPDTSALDVNLTNILHIGMSNAISRADKITAAQMQEAIRCVKQLGPDGCKKIIRLIKDDYRRRSDYIAYLTRAKQGLLCTVQFLERSTIRAKQEGDTYSNFLTKECIRLWLEQESQTTVLNQFLAEFCQATTVDEKNDLLERFLCSLTDLFIGNRELNEWQITKVEASLEYFIFSKAYRNALHPNGDADIHRDNVLQEHIHSLQNVVSPSHRDLKIPKYLLAECPWPSAQMELKMLSAYTTPLEKLRCVIRSASLIMNLLSSSSEKPVAADDIVPVFVYVIIKCNPPSLLSTIQYINSFCSQRISGEDQYWWTQFCSSVEFIKTMDYQE